MAKEILFKNGKTIPIVDETDRYYICEGAKYRKCNDEIDAIQIFLEKQEMDKAEEEKKSKPASKKKSESESETEIKIKK